MRILPMTRCRVDSSGGFDEPIEPRAGTNWYGLVMPGAQFDPSAADDQRFGSEKDQLRDEPLIVMQTAEDRTRHDARAGAQFVPMGSGLDGHTGWRVGRIAADAAVGRARL